MSVKSAGVFGFVREKCTYSQTLFNVHLDLSFMKP